MQEKTLLNISLITSIIGITLLFLISGRIDFNKESLLNAEGGDSVLLQGQIIGISTGKDFTKIKIIYQETAEIIVFESLNLTKNDFIEVTGTINNKKEITAEKIKISYLKN